MCKQSTLMLPCYLSTQQQLKGARSSPAVSMQQSDASHIPQEPRQLQPQYTTYTGLQAWAGEVFSKSRPTFLPSWAAVKTAQKMSWKSILLLESIHIRAWLQGLGSPCCNQLPAFVLGTALKCFWVWWSEGKWWGRGPELHISIKILFKNTSGMETKWFELDMLGSAQTFYVDLESWG